MNHQNMNGLKWLLGTSTQNQVVEEPGRPEKIIVREIGKQNSSSQEYSLTDLMIEDALRNYILFTSLSIDC